MVKEFRRRVVALAAAALMITATAAPAFAAVNVDGGSWDYGTSIAGWGQKKVWSNYYHDTRVHKSSCYLGTLKAESGWTVPKQTSFSSVQGDWGSTGQSYYDVK